ncbi:MAG: O-antigen ligase family protein [Hyphomicrobium sp.]
MVFTQELDRSRHPVSMRLWGICVGTWLMGCITVCMVSPRTIAFTLPILLVGLLLSYYARQGLSLSTFSGVLYHGAAVLVFAAFAMTSAFWAADKKHSLIASAGLMTWVLVALAGIALMRSEPRHNQFHMAEGLWLGFIIGLIYLFIEILSDQSIKIFLYNTFHVPKSWLRPPTSFTWANGKVVSIAPFDLTRSIAPIPLLVWTVLLCLRVTAPRNKPGLWGWLIYALTFVVIMVSESETSKVAIVAASAVFALSRWNTTAAAWLLRIGWVAACLAVVPVALSLYRANLHNAPWLQMSAQHRIIIWNNTAEYALKAPLIGVGAGMMYQMDVDGELSAGHRERMSASAPHAHNVFLQTWFELGAIGAALLTFFGLGIIEAIQRVSRKDQPYGHALLASAMCVAASSYGMWQAWFLAMFAMSAICFTLGARVNARAED